MNGIQKEPSMNAVQVEQKSYEMPPREGFTVAHFLTVADIERSARFYEKVFAKHSTLPIHSRLPHSALNGSNACPHNLEAREFATTSPFEDLQHNCREQRLTPETR